MTDYDAVYQALSPLERVYWHRFRTLFARVDARQPEKGILVLFDRAREQAWQRGLPYEEALAEIYRGAEERTGRRVELLSWCSLENAEEPG